MAKMSVRFKRVAKSLFHEAAAGWGSSGSDHSPAESSDLLSDDLVNFFLQSESIQDVDLAAEDGDGDGDGVEIIGRRDKKGTRRRNCLEREDSLQSLITAFNDDDDDPAKTNIRAAVEEALQEAGNGSSADYKWRLMARLRQRGFDAGLCKAKWEKTINSLPGYHECIDVMLEGSTRYIVEVSLSKEFEIARPTDFYTQLLQRFPAIYVGKPHEMKKIVRVMCESMKKSMKNNGMKVPPWRRLGYMNAKWFNSYKRTTNDISTSTSLIKAYSCCEHDDIEGFIKRKRLVGFVTSGSTVFQFCGERFIAKSGKKLGSLAAAMQDDSFAILKA